jgi:hypothetical protein
MKKIFFVFTLFVFIILSSGSAAYAYRPDIHADSVLAYTNAERYKRGLPMFSSNKLLSEVAKIKMYDMFNKQYFAHESPDGKKASDLAKSVGYRYIAVGENLALGDFVTSKDVVEAWMNSEGHRKNILSKTFTEIGIAAGKSYYDGRKTWIIVQSFGLPKSSCPAVDVDLQKKIKNTEELLRIFGNIAEIRKKEIDDKTLPLSVRKSKVNAYNIAARLYNETVEKYTKLADEYNSEVSEYNTCLKKAINKM